MKTLPNFKHTPVPPEYVIEWPEIKPDCVVIDIVGNNNTISVTGHYNSKKKDYDVHIETNRRAKFLCLVLNTGQDKVESLIESLVLQEKNEALIPESENRLKKSVAFILKLVVFTSIAGAALTAYLYIKSVFA